MYFTNKIQNFTIKFGRQIKKQNKMQKQLLVCDFLKKDYIFIIEKQSFHTLQKILLF